MKKTFINTELIKKYINQHKLTIKQFCKLCDIKYYNYRQLMLGDGNIKGEVLFRISKITNIRLKDLVGY
ncbi:MAG: helix-turn-helix transcriptional regulator [Clostridia bacterium]|nr:helix-turn-helix transcriptional regulator [Clostridia bacterium]